MELATFLYITFAVIYLLIVCSTVLVIVLDNRQPVKTVAWILVVSSMPVLGLVIYFFFGRNHKKNILISRTCSIQLARRSAYRYFRMQIPDIPEEHRQLINLFRRQSMSFPYPENQLHVIRPTVIFGEGNRGNVYNLFHQLAMGRFLMVGDGKNRKSMAYVGNIAAFLKWNIELNHAAYSVYNYIDKPDYDMYDLVNGFERILNKHLPPISLPYWLGLCGGYCFDILAFITRKNFPISSIRVRKFCAQTIFKSDRMQSCGFIPPYPMPEALRRTVEFEFLKNKQV